MTCPLFRLVERRNNNLRETDVYKGQPMDVSHLEEVITESSVSCLASYLTGNTTRTQTPTQALHVSDGPVCADRHLVLSLQVTLAKEWEVTGKNTG